MWLEDKGQQDNPSTVWPIGFRIYYSMQIRQNQMNKADETEAAGRRV